ncbi:hypothetical protein KDA11_05955 [Candidatus Saccharibacteria bacterium]|nr:hypothetical protein [Candidatus Saccharibacteria bacterium]
MTTDKNERMLAYLKSLRFYEECLGEGLITPTEYRKTMRREKKKYLGSMPLTPEEMSLPKSEVCRQRCTELNKYCEKLTREAALEAIKIEAKAEEQRAFKKLAEREALLKQHYHDGRLTHAQMQENTIVVLERCNKTIKYIREKAELRQRLAEYKWQNEQINAQGVQKAREVNYLRALETLEAPNSKLRGILRQPIMLGVERRVSFMP